MKKTLITLIVILIALIMALVLFIIGFSSSRKNNTPKVSDRKPTDIYRENMKKVNDNDDAVDPEKHKYADSDDEKSDTNEEDEFDRNEEGERGSVISDEKESDGNDSELNNETEKPQTSLYKVRKSKYDSASQLGAFENRDNAIALANQYRDEGYKVFLDDKCIYAP